MYDIGASKLKSRERRCSRVRNFIPVCDTESSVPDVTQRRSITDHPTEWNDRLPSSR